MAQELSELTKKEIKSTFKGNREGDSRIDQIAALFNRVVRKLKMWYNLSAGYERRKLESSLYGVTLIHI